MPGTGWDRWRLAYATRRGAGRASCCPPATRRRDDRVPRASCRSTAATTTATTWSIEALHIFVAAGETLVNDATDVGNAPMAASFARVGYRVTGRRMVFGDGNRFAAARRPAYRWPHALRHSHDDAGPFPASSG